MQWHQGDDRMFSPMKSPGEIKSATVDGLFGRSGSNEPECFRPESKRWEGQGLDSDDGITAFDLIACEAFGHFDLTERAPHSIHNPGMEDFDNGEIHLLEGVGVVIDIDLRHPDGMRFEIHLVDNVRLTLVEHDRPLVCLTVCLPEIHGFEQSAAAHDP